MEDKKIKIDIVGILILIFIIKIYFCMLDITTQKSIEIQQNKIMEVNQIDRLRDNQLI